MSEESPNTRISPQTQPSLHEQIADAVRTVRETTPLAQSFTNFVTINLVANAQLAAGGAAAMSFLPDDIIDTATISGADYINVGTLLPFYKDALPQVARAFHNTGHPWVLDPVAAGIGETRTAILQSFKRYPPTVIRGNASEIIALDAMWGLNEESATATASAQRLARFMARHGANGTAAVAVSGATDMVTDGEHVYRLAGGSAMMTKITGAGCSLGGVTAVYLAVAQPLIAALAATSLYNTAGEIAEKRSNGPGSFQVALLDALWNVTAEEVADRAIDMR